MKFQRGHWIIIILNILVILGFLIYYVSIKNYEFLWYIGVLVFFLVLILSTLHRSRFDYTILIGLSLWGFLHMAGGGVVVNGEVLYKFPLWHLIGTGDSLILKFDQFVHFFGFGVMTLVLHHLLVPYLGKKVNWKVLFPILVLAGMGAGALNEIVEYIAVLTFDETGVGGYINTMLDIVFNTLGAIAAVIMIHFRRMKKANFIKSK